jgi:hypothetical protein
MADYFTPTVVQQTIPLADMTALERLILSHILDAEPDGDGLYFFSDTGPSDLIVLSGAQFRAAFAESQGIPSRLRDYVAERLPRLDPNATDVELDVSGTSWEFFLQDIVRRSRTLQYVTVVSAFTCSKMRPDGFGGSATLVTADDIKSKSTNDILEEYVGGMEDAQPGSA